MTALHMFLCVGLVGLRYFANGGLVLENARIHGISKSSVYRAVRYNKYNIHKPAL